jgi:uncharacterized protein (DUF111 family)
MHKPAKIIQFQVDHLTGEEVGHLIERLCELGAHGVQAVPAVGKKNRPGHVLFADLGSGGSLDAVARLTAQFGVFGFHVIETMHHYHETAITEHELTLRCGGREMTARVRLKGLGPDGGLPGAARVEFDDLVDLAERLRAHWGLDLALSVLRQRVEATLTGVGDPELDFG